MSISRSSTCPSKDNMIVARRRHHGHRNPHAATAFPCRRPTSTSLGFRNEPDRPADRADRAPHRGGPLSRLPDRARPPRQARAVQELRQRRHRTAPRAAADDTLWLLYSNTKVVTAVALWVLAERGLFGFSDKIADHVPEFAKHAKGNITVLQTITHQAGFPNAVVGKDAWADHKRLREVVCNFPLEWTPGSKVHYHGLTAHWTLGVLIEAVTGKDFRDVIRETVTEPLGLAASSMSACPRASSAAPPTCTSRSPSGRRLPAARRRQHGRLAQGRRAGRRRLRHGARDGGALPDDAERRRAQRHAPRLAAHAAIRHPQPHRRPGRRVHGHADASRPRARTCAARPRTSAASAASPARAPSAMAASARPTAGAIPIRACPSPTSPTTASPIPGTASASTRSRTSCTRRSSRQHASSDRGARGRRPRSRARRRRARAPPPTGP